MTVRIFLAPAASGKTTYVLRKAQQAAKNMQAQPLILVPTSSQKYALRRRLAMIGGALGVRIETFSDFSKNILETAGEKYTTITKPIQRQLLRHVVGQQKLSHYRPLVGKPGFVEELARVIHDLKAAKIWPDDFLGAVNSRGHTPRLHELGLIYKSYQSELHRLRWADESGWAWLAVEALEKNVVDPTSRWPLLIVDGFDNYTEVLLAMLKILASMVDETIITLTKESETPDSEMSRQTFRLFQTTKEHLEIRLGVKAEPLPNRTVVLSLPTKVRSNIQAHLERNLFIDSITSLEAGNNLTLIACPDRAMEVRAALRWLKEKIVHEEMQPQEVALLARTLSPYEPFIRQTAAEFGLPVHLAGKLPLRANPAIVAIIKLLELHLPASESDPGPALPRQGVVDAWRSPYFDWADTRILPDHGENAVITPADADDLDALARNGRVIGGLDQWQELFQLQQSHDQDIQTAFAFNSQTNPRDLLAAKFHGFRELLVPPSGPCSYREFTQWLDTLLGPDPEESSDNRIPINSLFFQLGNPDDSKDKEIFQRDMQALRALKEIMRSMVWVEDELGNDRRVSYGQYFNDLVGMIDATTYTPPEWLGSDKILVADVIGARGLTFRAVAVMGMAEGEFPKTYVEDPFLWEDDRSRLGHSEDVLLDSSIESYEREYFYQAVTRPREKLLLTRPRLADSGAEWQPSPFWEEVQRLFDVQSIQLSTESIPAPDEAASLTELVGSMVFYPDCRPAMDHLDEESPDRIKNLHEAARNFDQRYSTSSTPLNGDLRDWARLFRTEFEASYGWSPSSLEGYHSCPYLFFVGRVLKLKPRMEPAEGLDAAQLGSIYHQIFEQLYRTLDLEQRTDPEKLRAILPSIARIILDEAPAEQGFRETAWWRETRQEIANNVARSIVALAEIQEDFVPVGFEQRFFGPNTLTVYDGDDHFLLRGVIDRVDRDQMGRSRIVDYKTAGPYSYTKQTLESGDKIQIALYALAARDALDQGEPVDGFYWHIQQAQASRLTLREYGPSEAIDVAVGHAWDSVRGARQGYFIARPPADGCPSWCPAAAFCWNYRPGMWR